ncbi:Ser-Thr-rich glycosyl-phosphatidyl-inositol-anchored membrane family-domain-containing protein [Filobasidium floriforme]|uniref:Ser-Thr-rich glycosyl-phosphatidyl-inositol-anchored membrane family-domain-containing protein n=1 Tax=Filobasidium floriforme TaxID=5210 RepID=UPI001E8D1F0B|nr:Ser-Thr-rich glycosyl-phosphatidyl-inositol-anchored membrane family-domain-containing protein [Filobasidium floriforme]KAH8089300.1 Ser-Thr-rich glycosyl-phosphatidyl-inositol-anchored membrane family-domain-containing protein [Filobasidium floriforme]
MLAKLFLAPLFALAVQAVTVTSPTEGQNWGTSDAQTVSWDAVSTDPTSFSIVLVNDNRLTAADGQVTLIANQSTSAGSVSVSPPSGSFTTGQAYRIRLVRDNAILASSGQFNITSSGAAGSSVATTASASASGSMSMGGMSSATRSVPTAMTSAGVVSQSVSSAPYTGNNQNTGIPPAASQSAGNGAVVTGVNMLVLGGAGIALGYLVGA